MDPSSPSHLPRPPHSAHGPSLPRHSSRSGPAPARPLSMPPQAYNLAIPGLSPGPSTPRSTTPVSALAHPDRPRPAPDDTASIRRRDGNSKSSRSTHRLLGDYLLTKLLGAGSMGKVKLAIHNVTGEKVRSCCFFPSLFFGLFFWFGC